MQRGRAAGGELLQAIPDGQTQWRQGDRRASKQHETALVHQNGSSDGTSRVRANTERRPRPLRTPRM